MSLVKTVRLYANRLRFMSPMEVAWRVGQLGTDKLDFLRRKSVSPAAKTPCAFRPLIPVESLDLEGCRALWEENPWHDSILSDLLEGRYHWITETFDVGINPDWHRDPTTGRNLPLIQGRKYLFQKMYRMANILFLRTLNRHYHFVHLAKGVRMGKCGVETLRSQFLGWIDANPYLEGINWADSLDTAMRLLHWCLTLSYLPEDALDPELSLRIQNSVHQQATFIERHLSLFSSANNHLLGEYVGLLVAGLCFPQIPGGRRWLEIGKKGVEEQVLQQFTGEGVHRERSLCYHRLLVEHLLVLHQACRSIGNPFGEAVETVLRKGLDHVARCLNESGEVPFLGDFGQEAVTDMHYMAFKSTNSWISLIRLGKSLGLYNGPFPEAWLPEVDDRTAWVAPSRRKASTDPRTPLVRTSERLNETGLYFLRDGSPFEQETSLVFRCGPMGYPDTCAHAHADQLSFVLSVCGKQILVDPGTYEYYLKGPEWRNYFRGTSAHNTLMIDGVDQAESGGSMMWLRKASGRLIEWSPAPDETKVCGLHDGYSMLPDPVVHTRTIRMIPDKRRIEFQDRLDGVKEHRVDFFLHFHPDVVVEETRKHCYRARREDREVTIYADPSLALQLRRADEHSPCGWYSPVFCVKLPCFTLMGKRTVHGKDSLSWVIEYK
ncbi:MAG: alginate lyase family protein [Acidobacteriota bacterium]